MPLQDLKNIISDTVRCAPVLSALSCDQYDYFMTAGPSVRVRDKRSGYFRFVIEDAEDIPRLTDGVMPLLSRIVVVDTAHEDIWRDLLPGAEFKRYRLTSVTRDMLRPPPVMDIDTKIVSMDESWYDLAIKLCEDEEFTAESLKAQFRENLSLGLIWHGERTGFISTHLNGELGPLWIDPKTRGNGLGTVLMGEYLRRYLCENEIVFGLSGLENIASARIMENLGFNTHEKDILHIMAKVG